MMYGWLNSSNTYNAYSREMNPAKPDWWSTECSNEWFFSYSLIYILLQQYAAESGIGTGFPTLFTRLLVGCQRFIEPVSHLFFINQIPCNGVILMGQMYG
jgi:hypothetical protein